MLRAFKALLAIVTIIFIAGGCQSSKIMPVEAKLRDINVGENSSDEVLDMFSGFKVLQTTDKISVLKKSNKFAHELAIVSIEPDSSELERYVYTSRSKDLVDVNLRIVISTKVGPEVLLKPYESEDDKNLAIMKFCHKSLRNDAMEFANDKEGHDFMSLASMVLGVGIAEMEQSPRDIADISTEKGFTYEHTTAGECKIRLDKAENSDIYTLSVHTKESFDWLVKW